MKLQFFIMVLALGLLVAGCTDKPDGPGITPYIGGTDGVSVQFDGDAPPAEINAGGSFNAVIILENSGEYSVEEGEYYVKLMGFSPDDFGTTTQNLKIYPDEKLQGNELIESEVFESYPVYVTFPSDESFTYSGASAGKKRFPFSAEACYRYVTNAIGDLCIKQDLARATDDRVCMISSQRSVSVSSAPVQINNLREYGNGRDAIRFTFNVMAANTGGQVSLMSLGDPAACDVTSSFDEDKLYLTIDAGMGDIQCNGFIDKVSETGGVSEGVIKLGDAGSRQVSCTLTISETERFNGVKPLEISAEYDYEHTITQDVIVKQFD